MEMGWDGHCMRDRTESQGCSGLIKDQKSAQNVNFPGKEFRVEECPGHTQKLHLVGRPHEQSVLFTIRKLGLWMPEEGVGMKEGVL